MYDLHGTESGFVHRRLLGAAGGFLTGGIPGAAAGFVLGGGGSAVAPPPVIAAPRRLPGGGPRVLAQPIVLTEIPRPVTRLARAAVTFAPTAPPRPVTRLLQQAVTTFAPAGAALGPCEPGFVLQNGVCVRAGGVLPSLERTFGTDLPGGTVVATGGGAVVGAFGMPAMVPARIARSVLQCPRGAVLGTDNLCYPKGVLSARNLHRKWRRSPRPPVSAADAKAIRRANSTRERVLSLAKDVGLHASKTKPSSRPRAPKVSAAPHQLAVVHEVTN